MINQAPEIEFVCSSKTLAKRGFGSVAGRLVSLQLLSPEFHGVILNETYPFLSLFSYTRLVFPFINSNPTLIFMLSIFNYNTSYITRIKFYIYMKYL